MKVKLLKKVRKRYSIARIDELASNAGNVYKGMGKSLGLPFFVLEDQNDSFGYQTEFFKTFEEARDKIIEWVISDYGEKFRHKDEVSEKVWYVGKK